jgi:thiol-disulfide isomerase/thioredoxin
MKYMSFLIYSFLFLVFLGLSCSKSQEEVQRDRESLYTAEKGNIEQIEELDPVGLEKLISSRNGKILVINIWATWCIPCREEFPDLVKLASTYPNGEVEIVGISVDYPDEVESKILPFLKAQKTNFKNYVQNFERQEDLINRLNQDWIGAIPATFIYDKRGKQRNFLRGQQTFESFRHAIGKVQNES